ncbi:MAG: PD40 domain-containing protein [Myxococcales bacterium]|nr:PD40 domain-containing protein [Myxococcales bacterium]
MLLRTGRPSLERAARSLAGRRAALCWPLALAFACGDLSEGRDTVGVSGGFTNASASDSDSDSGDDETTGASGASSAETSGSAGESTTSGDPTVDPGTSDPTSDPSATTSATGDSSSTGTTDDPTGDPPASCWGSGLNDWELLELNEPGLGDSPSEPALSSDGLTLWYSAKLGGDLRRPYKSTRPSQEDPFVSGAVVATWPGTQQGFDRPRPLSTHELALIADGDVWLSIRTGDSWAQPVVMDDVSIPWVDPDKPTWWLENLVTMESPGSAVEDGSRFFFTRQSGPTNVELDSPINRFLVGRRAAFAAPGSAYTMIEETPLPASLTGDYPYPLYCPTISPDGEHLFFASTYPSPVPVDPAEWIDKLVIQHVGRANVDADWGEVTTLSSLSIPNWQACPAGVTPDGCQLVFTRNLMTDVLPDEQDRYRIFVATRS